MRRSLLFVLAALLALAAMTPLAGPTQRVAPATTATTIDAVNLRAGPGTWHPILLTMPAGSGVSIDGDPQDGFYPVTYAGTAGWAAGVYLSIGGTRTATTTAALNLRTGPSFVDWVVAVIPAGASVTLTGGSVNGYLSVSYNGTDGWAAAAYLTTGQGAGGIASTTAAVNLRTGPSFADWVIAVVPAGATVETTGGAVNGFVPVWYAGQSGWVSAAYLGGGAAPQPGGSTIAWPFQSGSGAWTVTQGYNGPWSHWNAGPYYQYRYSLDLARVDGATPGQPVLSPVTGTIRWIDWAAGGMSIDLGNGYAVAYFHTYVGGWLAEGQRVNQGDYLGAVAWPWEKQNGGSPHLHLTLWQTNDGGNWSRIAAPFTGPYAIEGVDFPDWAMADQHRGTVVWP